MFIVRFTVRIESYENITKTLSQVNTWLTFRLSGLRSYLNNQMYA